MNCKRFRKILLMLLLINAGNVVFGVVSVKGSPAILRVPLDFATIQEAVDAAKNGDTIRVDNGTYFVNETIFIENKEIILEGEDPRTTIIDGNGIVPSVINVFNSSNVIISNFTIRNTMSGFESYGISTYQALNVTLLNNFVTKTYYGILLGQSNSCKIMDNTVTESYNTGIVLRGGSSLNTIVNNLVKDNPNGIYIESGSQYNVFYRNNIINNTRQVNIFPPSPTSWDNGVEGNYWDDYRGIDINGDGVGDTELPHLDLDSSPLIEPWNETRTFVVNSHKTVVKCNYTIASFGFNQTLRQISFYITGPPGWKGFCNVTIPKELLSPKNSSEKWLVMLGPNPIPYVDIRVGNSTLISFTYILGPSTSNEVRLRVGTVYPPTANFEFAPDPASTIDLVNFTDVSVNGPNGTIVWRMWDLGDGTYVYNETFVRHRFENKTLFNVTLTVGDTNGLTDSMTKFVSVRNLNPLANFTFSPDGLFVGLDTEFNATWSSDLDGNITEYRWNFGDGTPMVVETNPITVHMFARTGTFKVNLTVTDSDGARNSMVQLVSIGKGMAIMEIEAPIAVKVEELFIVRVTLRNYGGQPLAGQQVRIAVYDDYLILSKNTTTDDNGVATANFSLSTIGQNLVRVEYYGSNDYVGSNNTIFVTVESFNTTLSLFVPENATVNEDLALSAVLQDEDEKPVYNVTLELYFHNGSSWELLEVADTNQSGTALFSFIPKYAGTFMLKVAFNGTEKYAPSHSEQTLNVTSSGADSTIYFILVAVVVISVGLAFIVLKKRKVSSRVEG